MHHIIIDTKPISTAGGRPRAAWRLTGVTPADVTWSVKGDDRVVRAGRHAAAVAIAG